MFSFFAVYFLQVHLTEHEMNNDLIGSSEVVVRSVSPHPNSKTVRDKVRKIPLGFKSMFLFRVY